MRSIFALTFVLALGQVAAHAHGPQLQLTRDNNQITTRRIFLEEPYSQLSPETSVYVIPLLETGGVWYSRPNNQPNAIIPGIPAYLSGPGITYGYDQVAGGPRDFASGYNFLLNIIDGLKIWDGAGFSDPGLEQIEAYRSSGSPAISSDSLTPASPATLQFGNVSASYNASAHGSASFRLLGDGVSPTVEGQNGVYLLSLTYSSSEPGLNASNPFYFLLHKNASGTAIAAAVNGLMSTYGIDSSMVQYVPEPSSIVMLVIGAAAVFSRRRPSNR